jgi:hypothetical protein
MNHDNLPPHGESLRRAMRWLSDERRHDAAAIEEAARRFDLTPFEEEFLLVHCRESPPDDLVDIRTLREVPDRTPVKKA